MTAATARRMVERRMSEGNVECISRMLIHPEPAASSSLPWPSADRLRGGPDAAGGTGGDAPRHGAADTGRRLTSGAQTESYGGSPDAEVRALHRVTSVPELPRESPRAMCVGCRSHRPTTSPTRDRTRRRTRSCSRPHLRAAGMAKGHRIRQGPELAQQLEDCLKTLDCRRPSGDRALGGGRAHLDHHRTTAGGDGRALQTWSVRCSSLFPSRSTPSKRPATRPAQSTRSRTHPLIDRHNDSRSLVSPAIDLERAARLKRDLGNVLPMLIWVGRRIPYLDGHRRRPELAGGPDRHEYAVGPQVRLVTRVSGPVPYPCRSCTPGVELEVVGLDLHSHDASRRHKKMLVRSCTGAVAGIVGR
jgi:hypothetical protein